MARRKTPSDVFSEKTCEYLLVADFDVDTGSVLSHQYPVNVSMDEQKLADCMLPDGAHNREEDWTTFFINKEFNDSVRRAAWYKRSLPVMEAFVYQYADTGEGWEQLDVETKFVQRLPTKIIVTQRDGEELITLDPEDALQYTRQDDCFVCCVTAEAAVGLRFQTQQEQTDFTTHCDQLLKMRDEERGALSRSDASLLTPSFLYCLNLVRTRHDPSYARGARVKAMCICTRHPFIHVLKPLLLLALDKFFATPDVAVLRELYDAINAMDLTGVPRLSEAEKRIRRGALDQSASTYAASVQFGTARIPLRIPIAQAEDDVGQPKLLPLVNKFGAGIMTLFNALLRGRRVIFLGHSRPAGEVCECVLAAAAMVSPPLRGILKTVFPYVSLVNMDFLSLPSYIAGTTNVLFQDREEWWDLLCDIDSGRVTVNPKLPPDSKEGVDPHATADAFVYNELKACVQNHFGEEKIRSVFQDYATHICEMARGTEEYADETAHLRERTANEARLGRIVTNPLFKKYCELMEVERVRSIIPGVDLARQVKKLRVRQSLTTPELLGLYTDLHRHVRTDEHVLELLQHCPESNGGVFPLATALFSSSMRLRVLAVRLLTRIESLKVGHQLLASLNAFSRRAYERNRHLAEVDPESVAA